MDIHACVIPQSQNLLSNNKFTNYVISQVMSILITHQVLLMSFDKPKSLATQSFFQS
jgi:hypothetical protein